MKPNRGAVAALLLLATCNENSESTHASNVESSRSALGKVPPSEIAVWKQVGGSSMPEGRYLQAAAFDEARKVVVMFGGAIVSPYYGVVQPNQETWEWSPATGRWTNRTSAGTPPESRSGAVMVFDSARNKMVLFGGRSGSGYNFEDTWEYDTATGVWTNVSSAGSHPSARSQQAMVYEKSSGKVLLFGGGRSDVNSWDGTGISASIGETWEWDAATQAWAQVTTVGTPSVRHDSAMVWDSTRNVAVLFGGLQTDIPGASGVPKQDTWEYDPATKTWTDRTTSGSKPSQRYGHAMAYDTARAKVVMFGGWDINSGGSKNDMWDWDPTTASWKQRLTGTESNIPTTRIYATMMWNESQARLLLVAGSTAYNPGGKGPYPPGFFPTNGSREVWEIDPATATCTDRTLPVDVPQERTNHAMAFNPATDKTYIFGGYDMMGQPLDDLWAWDGSTWSQVATDVRPPARADAGLAYDPARKSLILFGGTAMWGSSIYSDTWEFTSTGKWVPLTPSTSPDPLYGPGMVTDAGRGKIILFGGQSNYFYPFPGGGPDAGAPSKNPIRNEVWEWDGATTTWTNRTPVTSQMVPVERMYPTMAFDEGRQKLFLYDGPSYSYSWGQGLSAYWEWDPVSGGWSLHDPGDDFDYGYTFYAAYDSIRRREVLLTDAMGSQPYPQTWELDARNATWYIRSLPSTPQGHYYSTMAFDSRRGVMVLFGGIANGPRGGGYSNDTWEYQVTSLGNGEGCTVGSASNCASGNCVDGVCCESASCTGPCKSCNVAGSEGTCVLATAGTEVAGSCSNGQACDGNGNCKSGNGQACSEGSACASGYCVDGVCCDGACTGACVACNVAGRAGKCSPYAAGTDPAGECGKGTGVCKSTCDGVGACTFPASGVSCGNCMTCDGAGTCGNYDPFCVPMGGAGGGFGGTGGIIIPPPPPFGGAGGFITGVGGIGGGTTARGGAGGIIIGGSTGTGARGGTGGLITGVGGTGGTVVGGSTGTSARGGTGGFITGVGGTGGTVVGGSTGTLTTSRGGSGGSSSIFGTGGSLPGKPDGGILLVRDASNDAITSAYLRRSGCSCEVGQAQAQSSHLTWGLFLAVGAVLTHRLRRRRR